MPVARGRRNHTNVPHTVADAKPRTIHRVPPLLITNATYDETIRGFEADISHVTHLFNAMPSLYHREPGPLPAIFSSPTITVQIILVKRFVRFTGCSLLDAIRTVTEVPAKVLALYPWKGTIRESCDADLTVIDDAVDVRATIVGGQIVYEKAGNCRST